MKALALSLILCLSYVQQLFFPLSPERLYEAKKSAVLSIQVYEMDKDGRKERLSSCSGVLVDPEGEILTTWNNLVAARRYDGQLRPETAFFVLLEGGDALLEAKLMAKSTASDLALLKLVKPPKEPLPYLHFDPDTDPAIGTKLYVLGHPDPETPTGELGTGLLSQREAGCQNEWGHPRRRMQSTASISRGSSGGAVLDAKGKAIGMATWTSAQTYSDRTSFICPAPLIADALKRLRAGEERQKLSLGLFLLEEGERLRLQKLYQRPEGLVVADVVEESPAYVANVHKGDIIVAVNGMAVEGLETLTAAVDKAKVGDALTLTVLPEGKGERVDLSLYFGPLMGD